MGVRGLQTYLEQCCQSASPTVSISDLASNIRESSYSPDQELIIVVDGSSCIRHLYGNLEWIGGAQLKQYGEKAQHFVQAFANLGIRLVFFFDGPTAEKKRKTWVERRMSKLGSMYIVLDAISNGTPTHVIPKKHFHLPPGMGQLSRVIFKTVCHCEVYQSLTECDEEIAEYARNNRVFAILGQDSDYVIMDTGNTLYLSIEHLNLRNMTTRLYDRWELARSLRLHPSQLPLLATFMGNDIITAQDLRPFHLNVIRQPVYNRNINFRMLVPNIAMFVRTLPLDETQLFSILPDVAIRTLGHHSRDRDIITSLYSYKSHAIDHKREGIDMNDHWSRLVAEARYRHQINELPSMVYAIMSGLPFESATSIEDFRKNDLPTFASATQPIRERIYGILLQEKPLPESGAHLVPEWCMAGPGSLDQPNYVPAMPPVSPHPGLLALWNDGQRYLSVRWSLFVSSVSHKLDVSRVRSTVPSYLVIPTLILFNINELGCLCPWEVDAMLATASCMKYYNVTKLAALPSDPVSARGVRVANLIMRSTFILYFLLASCGYPLTLEETAPWLFFDGKLFQIKYNEAGSGYSHSRLCDNRVDVLEVFQVARSVVFYNDY
ncbi:constitutive coactivator of peroxisome proliferator-activated receptor gamma-like [Homalodisca vitripennis]|nr:constitutive coactivator of peroxisome proliferator-activated receptor gamma-like [Homalodisca vitripennis]